MSTADIAAAIKSLPLERKIELQEMIAADIVDSTPPDIKAAQMKEVMRCRQDWLDGKTKLIPGEQVMREMRRLLK
jgi:hypothetical protein